MLRSGQGGQQRVVLPQEECSMSGEHPDAERGDIASRTNLGGAISHVARPAGARGTLATEAASHMRTPSACLTLSLMTLGAACSQSDDHGLAAARSLWKTHGPSSYSFLWQESTFPEPVRISVTSGQITSVVFVFDQRPVPDGILLHVRTIDGLFDNIQDEIDQGADQLTVDFDPTLGYPTSLYVDPSKGTYDDEFTIRILEFTSDAN